MFCWIPQIPMQRSKTFQIFPKVPRSFFCNPVPSPGRLPLILVLTPRSCSGWSCWFFSGMLWQVKAVATRLVCSHLVVFFLCFLPVQSGLLAGKEDCTGETKRFLILRVGERVFKCLMSVTHVATHTEVLAISFSQGSASSGQRQITSLRKSSSGLGLIARLAICLLAPVWLDKAVFWGDNLPLALLFPRRRKDVHVNTSSVFCS